MCCTAARSTAAADDAAGRRRISCRCFLARRRSGPDPHRHGAQQARPARQGRRQVRHDGRALQRLGRCDPGWAVGAGALDHGADDAGRRQWALSSNCVPRGGTPRRRSTRSPRWSSPASMNRTSPPPPQHRRLGRARPDQHPAGSAFHRHPGLGWRCDRAGVPRIRTDAADHPAQDPGRRHAPPRAPAWMRRSPSRASNSPSCDAGWRCCPRKARRNWRR